MKNREKIYPARNLRRKLRGAGALLAAALLFLSGCASRISAPEEDDMRTPVDENLIVVGVSQLGSESVWRTANTASIQEVFTKEKGYFLIFDNARQKQENQIKALRSFISQEVDYIIFSPLMEEGWDTVLQEAKDAGIPVILIDRMVDVEDPSLYSTWIGSDFEKEGTEAGRILEKCLEEQGRQEEDINIVVLKGTEGSSPTIGRTEGFGQIAALHENWNILEQADGEFTTAKAREEMSRLLTKYEDIDVLISQNDDMTFGALGALRAAGRSPESGDDMIILSFDGTRKALELVESGVIYADLECNPQQGEYLEEVIQKLEAGQEIERIYYVPEKIFTRDNVSRYIEDRTY